MAEPTAEDGSSSSMDEDPLETLEVELERMERPVGAEERTTAAELLEGDTLEERLAREEPDRGGRRSSAATTIAEEDGPDGEPELVGERAETGGPASPEESAVHVVADPPGATDHEDDYVEE